MRKRIHDIIEAASAKDRASNVYDIFMMIVIVASIIPLAFKTEHPVFDIIDKIAVVIFIIDYCLRLFTADYQLQKGAKSFLLYPITPMALMDLFCILPSLSIISESFRLLKIFRLIRTFRVFRIFKTIRYSKSVYVLKGVFRNSKKPLMTVGFLALGYVLISALVIFNAEPDTFDDFFDAVYWATVSLTTVGYGDIYPVTTIGRIITMVSSVFGIAIIALPSGIITAGLMEEINKQNNHSKEKGKSDIPSPVGDTEPSLPSE